MLTKDATATRRQILEKAFALIHRKGFRATGLNEILRHTNLTKGAFYYHFPSKMNFGYALVEELLEPKLKARWLDQIKDCKDPINSIKNILQTIEINEEFILLGCPLNNLVVEMATINEGMRKRLEKVYEKWIEGFAEALSTGQKNGKVSKKIPPREAASFIVASLAGCRSIAKTTKSKKVLSSCVKQLIYYLDTLKV